MRSLQGKTAIITGAASGIGKATAIALAQRGLSLGLVDINAPALDDLQSHLQTSVEHLSFTTHRCDVSDPQAMEKMAQQAIAEHGGVDIVINNAGINITASFEEHTLRDFQRTFDVNLWGVIHGCRSFLPHLKTRPWGHLVNISSAFGIVGVASQSAYSASKFAVRGFSESLHEELADTPVDVSVVHPGCIATSIVESARIANADAVDEITAFFRDHGHDPDVVARRIIKAVERRTHRVVVTPEAYLLDLLRRLMPTTGNRIANRLMQRFMDTDLLG